MTDAQKIALAEICLDRRLTLETVKLWLGIEHSDSDGALRLLIATFDLNADKSRWGL